MEILLFFLLAGLLAKQHSTFTPHPAHPHPGVAPHQGFTPHATPHPGAVPVSFHPVPVSPPAWPAAMPAGLPPYPGPGWVPDQPPGAGVVARAYALLPTLWATGAGASKTEQIAGRWITLVAQMLGAKKAVIAYRLARPAAPTAAAPPPFVPVAHPDAVMASTHAGPTSIVPAVYHPAPHFSTPPPATSLPTLRLTSPYTRGPAVIHAQQRLGILADGTFGPATKAAVTHFQVQRGLSPDGVVGPMTWSALG